MFSFYFLKCGYCGRTFPSQSKNTKYCSDQCRKNKMKELNAWKKEVRNRQNGKGREKGLD